MDFHMTADEFSTFFENFDQNNNKEARKEGRDKLNALKEARTSTADLLALVTIHPEKMPPGITKERIEANLYRIDTALNEIGNSPVIPTDESILVAESSGTHRVQIIENKGEKKMSIAKEAILASAPTKEIIQAPPGALVKNDPSPSEVNPQGKPPAATAGDSNKPTGVEKNVQPAAAVETTAAVVVPSAPTTAAPVSVPTETTAAPVASSPAVAAPTVTTVAPPVEAKVKDPKEPDADDKKMEALKSAEAEALKAFEAAKAAREQLEKSKAPVEAKASVEAIQGAPAANDPSPSSDTPNKPVVAPVTGNIPAVSAPSGSAALNVPASVVSPKPGENKETVVSPAHTELEALAKAEKEAKERGAVTGTQSLEGFGKVFNKNNDVDRAPKAEAIVAPTDAAFEASRPMVVHEWTSIGKLAALETYEPMRRATEQDLNPAPRGPAPTVIRLPAPHQEAFGGNIDVSPIHESVMDRAREIYEQSGGDKRGYFQLWKEILEKAQEQSGKGSPQ